MSVLELQLLCTNVVPCETHSLYHSLSFLLYLYVLYDPSLQITLNYLEFIIMLDLLIQDAYTFDAKWSLQVVQRGNTNSRVANGIHYKNKLEGFLSERNALYVLSSALAI